MSETPDLEPAARQLGALLERVPVTAMAAATPCEGSTVDQLIGHLGGLIQAFTAAATKNFGPWTDTSPDSGGGWPVAEPGWREVVPEQALALAQAWQQPDAWEGMTRAGGMDLPGQIAGVVALDELVLHGWDLARATGQDYTCDEQTAAVLEQFVSGFESGGTPGMFGPAVEVASDASTFERVLAASGRDPGWSRPASA